MASLCSVSRATTKRSLRRRKSKHGRTRAAQRGPLLTVPHKCVLTDGRLGSITGRLWSFSRTMLESGFAPC